MSKKCGSCGSGKDATRFRNETFYVSHAGMRTKVEDLSGWRCSECADVVFDTKSARTYAAAGDALVARSRVKQGHEFRRIRQKLGLSQAAAARLTGGGHNAFSRYERGEAAPMAAVVNLFRLLDRHPELLKDLG